MDNTYTKEEVKMVKAIFSYFQSINKPMPRVSIENILIDSMGWDYDRAAEIVFDLCP